MSAFPPTANITGRERESASCQQPTHATAANEILFDHLISAGEQHRGEVETERLRGLEINREFEFRRFLNGQIRRPLTFQDTVGVSRRPLKKIHRVNPI